MVRVRFWILRAATLLASLGAAGSATSTTPTGRGTGIGGESVFSVRTAFEGLAYTGASKPDPTLAVGHDRILLAGDWSLELRDKNGSLLASRLLDAFFEPAPAPNGGGFNPRVVYDPQSQRFFVVTTDFVDQPCAAGACVANLLLAVSKSSSPDGLGGDDWHLYALDATLDGAVPTTNSADLPVIGMNDSAVVISSSMIGINDNRPKYAKLRILEKEKLLRGDPVTWTDLFGMQDPIAGGNAWQLVPAHSEGTQRLFFLTTPFTSSCSLTVWAIESPLQNPTLSARVAPAAGVCAPPPPPQQPGGAIPFDWTFNAIFGGIVHRGTSLWTTQSIASGGAAGIRWVEIDVSNWPGSVSYRRDFTLAQSGVSLFCPTITVDEDNNTLIAFARSGPRTSPPSTTRRGCRGIAGRGCEGRPCSKEEKPPWSISMAARSTLDKTGTATISGSRWTPWTAVSGSMENMLGLPTSGAHGWPTSPSISRTETRRVRTRSRAGHIPAACARF